jgi:RNA polymerase sigma factor (sigma-70 family)
MACNKAAESKIKELQQYAQGLIEIAEGLPALHRQPQEKIARQLLEQATTLTIKTYGAELRSWMSRKIGSSQLADDLFQETCASLWRGIPGFRWGSPEQSCSMRTWLYKIAFCAICRHHKKNPEAGFTNDNELSLLAEEITSMEGRVDKQWHLQACLQQLKEEDRLVVLLRQLQGGTDTWRELALALNGYRALPEDKIEAEANRLKQRFSRAIKTLRSIAIERGLSL